MTLYLSRRIFNLILDLTMKRSQYGLLFLPVQTWETYTLSTFNIRCTTFLLRKLIVRAGSTTFKPCLSGSMLLQAQAAGRLPMMQSALLLHVFLFNPHVFIRHYCMPLNCVCSLSPTACILSLIFLFSFICLLFCPSLPAVTRC